MIRILGTIFAGLLGLAFGSFLNVCLSRWPAGESVVQPRSHCRQCGRTLAWWENVPLVSWLALRGRCRTCRAWIGWRYPLVEAAVGALWVISVWHFSDYDPELPPIAIYAVLDLAVTWTHHASLLALFQNYSSAADVAHRAAYLAAAEYASSIYATPLLTFYIMVIPGLGELFAGLAMLKGRFGKACAWTGVVTGVFGILSLTGFFPVIMAAALGSTLWFFLVGVRLLRFGRTCAEGNE